ncbi:MAG: hypothetical protein WA129_04800, partial [Acidovorax sp.]
PCRAQACRRQAFFALSNSTLVLLEPQRSALSDQAIDYAAMSARKNAPRWTKQPKASGKRPATGATAARAAA